MQFGKVMLASVAGVGAGAYAALTIENDRWAKELARERALREKQTNAIRAMYHDLTADVPPAHKDFAERIKDRLTNKLTGK